MECNNDCRPIDVSKFRNIDCYNGHNEDDHTFIDNKYYMNGIFSGNILNTTHKEIIVRMVRENKYINDTLRTFVKIH